MIRVLFAIALVAQVSKTPPKEIPFQEGKPVVQPVPFSHRVHSGLGLKCAECHNMEPPGDYAGFPAEALCMNCHRAIKAESPHIAKLSEAMKSKTAVEWKRVYKTKEFVYFSHEVHAKKAGLNCGECHGNVAARDVLHQEKSISMYSCMQCHAARKAPNDCAICHDTH